MLLATRSLRLKLTLWYALVFLVIQLGLVVGVLALRDDEIDRAFEERIGGSAKAMIDSMLVEEVGWDVDAIAAVVPDHAGFVLFAIRDEAGEVLVSRGVRDPDALPFGPLERVPAGPVGASPRQLNAELAADLAGVDSPLRLVTVPFRHPEGDLYLQVAVEDTILERAVGPVVDLVYFGVPSGLIAALLTAWLIAGRAVSPIRRVSRAARAVSPRSIGEGLRFESSDQEVRMLQSELNQALERLRAGYEAQEQFLGNISHELKTPIAVLLTESSVLRRGDPTGEQYRSFASSVEEEMAHLGKLVESLLKLSRYDLAQDLIRVEGLSVNDVVLESAQHCSRFAQAHEVRLVPTLLEADSTEDEPWVAGDPELLATMVDNLVRNAVRFSPHGAAVEIEVARKNGAVSIEVRDEGPGIPADHIDSVFDRFVSLPRDSERAQGSGLGLAIARSVAEIHGGGISVANNDGRGCSFTVRIPTAPEGTPPAGRPRVTVPAGAAAP